MSLANRLENATMPRIVSIVALLSMIAGCPPKPSKTIEPAPTPDSVDTPFSSKSNVSSGNSIFDRPMTRLVVEFKVQRYTAPRGTFTSDAEIWKKITGPLPSAAMAQQLADNGFRAAVGRESDRSRLAESLDELRSKLDLRSSADQAVPDANKLVDLDLGLCDPRLALFYHDPQGHLRGMDFEDAKAKLLVSFEMRTSNLHEVTLKIIPALEEPPGPLKWVMTAEGAAQQVPEERRHVFDDVVLTAQIPDGGFLLLGASDIVYNLPYLGRPFFLEQDTKNANGTGEEPPWRESIFIISPIIRSLTDTNEKRGGRSG
jgi:hypothetical protein